MNSLYIYGFILLAIAIYKIVDEIKGENKLFNVREKQRKQQLKEDLENWKFRTDFKEYDEAEFWNLIDFTRKKSKGSYKNQMGLIRDKLKKMSAEEIIKLDNLVISLTKKAFTWDLYAASYIIYKSQNTETLYHLISLLISRGQYVFNNCIVNPNIIINHPIKDVIDITFSDLLGDIYYLKSKKIIPKIKDLEFQLNGEEWDENEIPGKYPELWEAFA